MADQVIKVQIDPREEPNDTAVQPSRTPITDKGNEARTGMKLNPVVLTAGITAGKQIFSAVTNNIGTFTGRTDLQRRINSGLTGARMAGQLGYAAFANPLTATALVAATAVEIGINVWETSNKLKLENTEAEFYRQVRGNRINESRYR